ncbi:ATP-binding cassette domain-containing protein [Paraferrimonas sp. SM1919]|uniref:peptide ABC transporter ATP-binding protein n=1 Tax=Paraferrimonas sp. SM1919 TaxID=2662263 RepID=UPI0013D17B93|nr:ATP-binding cassette domain-containing protein [Paraferrimonas sp. SM1919]
MAKAILQVNNLSKRFVKGFSGFKRHYLQALKPTSFELFEGETLAIVGETGSGKSTLAKILAGAESRSSGEILFDGQPLERRNNKQRCQLIRMIFQDPNTSLNPKLTIGELLEEPLRFNTDLNEEQRASLVAQNLRKVDLLPDYANYYPNMLSGGQRQRVAVARALMLDPKVIIADEALSELDMSVRAQIIALLLELQKQNGLSFIIVSHDLNIIKHISDRTMVMLDGEIVDIGITAELFEQPNHEYSRRLIEEQQALEKARL